MLALAAVAAGGELDAKPGLAVRTPRRVLAGGAVIELAAVAANKEVGGMPNIRGNKIVRKQIHRLAALGARR